MMTVAGGLSAFFKPNPLAFLGLLPLGPERSGYYSTEPLERTLEELVDLVQLNNGQPRLTVGAAKVQTGEMHYFDSRDCELTIKHVMASGALPPAFPAVRVDDDLYWDGGILSNTPVEAVFDDNPRRSGLIFAVHMWAPNGPEPDSIGRCWPAKKIFNMQAAPPLTSRGKNSCTSCATSSANLRQKLPAESRRRPRFERTRFIWLRHPHARRPPVGACARRRGPCQGYRLQPRLASSSDGRLDTPIRVACWRERRGPASSIRWKDSSCTKLRPAR